MILMARRNPAPKCLLVPNSQEMKKTLVLLSLGYVLLNYLTMKHSKCGFCRFSPFPSLGPLSSEFTSPCSIGVTRILVTIRLVTSREIIANIISVIAKDNGASVRAIIA